MFSPCPLLPSTALSHVKASALVETQIHSCLLQRLLAQNPNPSIQHARPGTVCPLPTSPAPSPPAPHAPPTAQPHCPCSYSVLGPDSLQPQSLCTSPAPLSPPGSYMTSLGSSPEAPPSIPAKHTSRSSSLRHLLINFPSDPSTRKQSGTYSVSPLNQLFVPFVFIALGCSHLLTKL